MESLRLLIGSALLLGLAACGPRLTEPKQLTAAEAAIGFSAPGIEGIAPKVAAVDERSFGAHYQILEWRGPSALAWGRTGVVFGGGGGYLEQFNTAEIASMFNEDAKIEPIADQRVSSVADPIWLSTFRLRAGGLSCVGIKRLTGELRDGHQIAGGRYLRTALIAYCTKQSRDFTLAEARAIADGIIFR